MFIFLLIPVCVVILSQVTKLILAGKTQSMSLTRIFSDYGGFPSSHTAFLTSFLYLVAVREGITSTAFAITIIFGLIIVRDAIGMRQFIEEQAIAINQLIAKLPKTETKKFHPMTESVGHTLPEVIVGALFGIVMSAILYQAALSFL